MWDVDRPVQKPLSASRDQPMSQCCYPQNDLLFANYKLTSYTQHLSRKISVISHTQPMMLNAISGFSIFWCWCFNFGSCKNHRSQSTRISTTRNNISTYFQFTNLMLSGEKTRRLIYINMYNICKETANERENQPYLSWNSGVACKNSKPGWLSKSSRRTGLKSSYISQNKIESIIDIYPCTLTAEFATW